MSGQPWAKTWFSWLLESCSFPCTALPPAWLSGWLWKSLDFSDFEFFQLQNEQPQSCAEHKWEGYSTWDSRQSCVALWPLSSHVSFPPVRAWPYYHLPGDRRRCSAPFWLKTTLFTSYPLGFYYLFFETWPLKSCAEILFLNPRYHPWCVEQWFPNMTNKTPIEFLKVFPESLVGKESSYNAGDPG